MVLLHDIYCPGYQDSFPLKTLHMLFLQGQEPLPELLFYPLPGLLMSFPSLLALVPGILVGKVLQLPSPLVCQVLLSLGDQLV